MDNHPIPQDVTNFEFRLIGEMTLKQFGYICGGVIFGWVALASPLLFILKVPLAGMLVFSGVILAFVPLEGRPSDVMLLHFFKAIFSPTQFFYKKGQLPINQPIAPLKMVTPPPQKEVKKEEEKKETTVQFTTTATIAKQAVTAQQALVTPTALQEKPQPVQTPKVDQQEKVLEQQVTTLTQELAQAKAEENQQQGTVTATVAHEKVIDLEKDLQTIKEQKESLEKQLVELQKKLNEKKEEVFNPSTAQAQEETQHVKKIPKQMSAKVGTPLVPDVPNLITGVIKDSRGNVLSNMLIEVKDKDGNPVRAFKTNTLGQFASATPLLNGVYNVSFEDATGKHTFDTVEITADGSILMPLEIISVDAREKLRQELFGK